MGGGHRGRACWAAAIAAAVLLGALGFAWGVAAAIDQRPTPGVSCVGSDCRGTPDGGPVH